VGKNKYLLGSDAHCMKVTNTSSFVEVKIEWSYSSTPPCDVIEFLLVLQCESKRWMFGFWEV